MFTNQAGADPYGASVAARYGGGLVPQGIAAELVAAKWDIGRSALDEFAVRSHELAAEARRAGRLGLSVVPVTVDRSAPAVTGTTGSAPTPTCTSSRGCVPRSGTRRTPGASPRSTGVSRRATPLRSATAAATGPYPLVGRRG